MSTTRMSDIVRLPLFAQSLVACRLARRAAQAMLTGEDQKIALDSCDTIEFVAKHGDGWSTDHPAVMATTMIRRTRGSEATLDALRWAFDSVAAAQAALDFPVDRTVTASANRAIQAVCSDSRVSQLQVSILVAADIDQIAFACKEANISTYDGVSGHVLERLAPCHALTLMEIATSAEEQR